MRIWIFSLFWFSSLGWAISVSASQVRLDSTGGLTTVLWDETSDITPYTAGNPAGLALLPVGARLGLTSTWFNVNNGDNSYTRNYFGITPSSNPAASSVAGFSNANSYLFQGFTDVTSGKWAFQEVGSYFTEQFSQSPDLQENYSQTVGVSRLAKDFGPLSLGLEYQYSGFNQSYAGSQSSTINQSGSTLNSGALLNLQLGDTFHPVWLRVGGSVAFNVVSPQIFGIFAEPNDNNEHLVETSSTFTANPGVHFEIPGIFQAALLMNVNNFNLTSSYTFPIGSGLQNQPTYLLQALNGVGFDALYKWKIYLTSPNDPKTLSLNNGIFMGINSNQSTQYNPDSTVVVSTQNTGGFFTAGVGLESKDDFMLGLQINSNGISSNVVQGSGTVNNVSQFNFTLGGERWFMENWAARIGLTVENNENTVNGFYTGANGLTYSGLMTTFGVGYDDKKLQLDGRVFYDEPSPNNVGALSDFYNIFGVEFSANLLF